MPISGSFLLHIYKVWITKLIIFNFQATVFRKMAKSYFFDFLPVPFLMGVPKEVVGTSVGCLEKKDKSTIGERK